MTILLIFDVETSGLLPKDYKPWKGFSDLSKFPFVIQLSYILYDLENQRLLNSYNEYINQNMESIDPVITNLTGISIELLQTKGVPIENALDNFSKACLECNAIIAHNLEFDSTMIHIENMRNAKKLSENSCNTITDIYRKTNNNIIYECTMQMTVDFCNLERINSRGIYKKLPKLAELYQILFGKIPENLHNSIVDVFACLRCYLKYKYKIDMDDHLFQEMIVLHL